MKTIPLIVPFLVTLVVSRANAYCYGVASCVCESKVKGIYIDCRGHGFTTIPHFTKAPEGILFYELNLQHNLITNLSSNALHGLSVQRLVLLDNPVSTIASDAFDGLQNDLRELVLSLAAGAELPCSSLHLLTNLELLEIHGYSKGQLPDGCFQKLKLIRHLTLAEGQLSALVQSDVAGLKQLSYISLQQNQFSAVPSAFQHPVGNLTTLILGSNRINRIDAAAFRDLNYLRTLDLSYNPLNYVDVNAFVGLGDTLVSLSIRYSHLTDASLSSVSRLQRLEELYISGNSITGVSEVIGDVKSLRILDAQGNAISTLSKSSYRSMSDSLRYLDLSGNPLKDIPKDTFAGLRHLEELQMNDIKGLSLHPEIFQSQATSLRSLSLRGVKFASQQWDAIDNLTVLEDLVLASCNIDHIPDFTFNRTARLRYIDLSANGLSEIRQRSLVGLQRSLIRLAVNGNNLTTLDSCVFHQFTAIEYPRLGLNSNPLFCDCRLNWLYDKVQSYTGPVLWKCSDGREFKSLPPETFSSCPKQSEGKCEDLLLPEVPPEQPLVLQLGDVTDSKVVVDWETTIRTSQIADFVITYRRQDALTWTSIPVGVTSRSYVLTGLQAKTTYITCVVLERTAEVELSSCLNVTTTAAEVEVLSGGSLSKQAIIGISVGACVVLLAVIIFVIIFALRSSRRQEEIKVSTPPTQGGHTKRFVRRSENFPSPEERNAAAEMLREEEEAGEGNQNAAIARTLVEMSDEERYRLINLLTNSSGSLNDLDGGSRSKSLRRATNRSLGGSLPYLLDQRQSMGDKHVYEEIPDGHFGNEELPQQRQELPAGKPQLPYAQGQLSNGDDQLANTNYGQLHTNAQQLGNAARKSRAGDQGRGFLKEVTV